MPHLILEYSANIESELDLPGLMEKLRDAVVESGVIVLGGVRVRTERRDQYLIADGDPENGFLHLMVRLAKGRPLEVRKRLADDLFALVSEHADAIFERRGFGLTMEFVEIEPETSRKRNNLHERLKGQISRDRDS